MRSEGWFEVRADALSGQFDQSARAVNIPIIDPNSQVGRRGAPAPRPDQDKLLIFQSRVDGSDGTLQPGTVGSGAQGKVAFRRNEQHPTDALNLSAWDHPPGGENNIRQIKLGWQFHFVRVAQVTLRPALQQGNAYIRVGAVGIDDLSSELGVYWRAVVFFKRGKQALHPFGKRSPAQQTIEGDHQAVDIHHATVQGTQVPIRFHLDGVTQERVLSRQNLPDGESLQGILFEINQIDVLLGVLANLFDRIGRLQQRMAERHQARMIISERLHCARTQPPDQPQESILFADLRRPAIQVAAEGHTGCMRHEIFIKLLTFHELEQHGNAFIVFHQPLGVAIEQRIRVDAGGIYACNGFGQGLQVFFGRALVGAKITVVFACKGIAKIVFQQAG